MWRSLKSNLKQNHLRISLTLQNTSEIAFFNVDGYQLHLMVQLKTNLMYIVHVITFFPLITDENFDKKISTNLTMFYFRLYSSLIKWKNDLWVQPEHYWRHQVNQRAIRKDWGQRSNRRRQHPYTVYLPISRS